MKLTQKEYEMKYYRGKREADRETYETLVLIALQARLVLARYPFGDAEMPSRWDRLAELLARLPEDGKL